ncbi:uncharacterized protein Z518_00836 [Rhinocladiella mackenziei CBS 650.93]|uniref:Uncharacterized protein n=1 Tax=Rhinocladiella mackenziei CBS 650.93 TaxID=1442369 RepID=A0A0D2JJW0_9EURO|nr:uncharacterized protein Z518_00836 [Rhinocladiella mackenziei CBS 650.93]KIX09755.1 hypothetical protein Z518_00836 [Rhinocladiella mackenziei CBS 650.93]
MAPSRSFLLWTIFPSFFGLCCGFDLIEIRPEGDKRSHLGARDVSSLDFRSAASFLWGTNGTSDTVLANFTVYTPGSNENVLSMETFDGMLISQNCTPNGMTLQFEDDSTFAYAQHVWDWVNGADNHTFLMIAGSGDCGSNKHRIPYLVSAISYQEDQNVAILNATTGSWHDMAKSYQLQIGSISTPNETRLGRRDITQGATLPLAMELPFTAKVEQGPLVGELECENCRTTGQINFELRITQNVIGIPDGVEFRMSPQSVSAVANLKLKVGSNFQTKKETFKETVLSFPLNGITIPPDILNIGPFLDIDAGVELTGLEGSITVSAGVTSSLSDSAILRANLLNPLDNDFSGWDPNIDFTPPSVEAQVAATVQMFFMPAVRLKAEALGQGVEAGIELKLPFVDFKVEATADAGGGVCDDPNKTLGVEIEPSIGAEIKFEAGTTDGDKTPVDVTIATTSFPLGGICLGFNPDDDSDSGSSLPSNNSSSNSTEPSSAKPSSSASTTSSAPVTSCTADNGLLGTCISTSSCSNQGGISEAGHCPGGIDIQCCYFSDGSGDSCQTNDGVSGTCMSTSACSEANAQSVSGFCPGPADIQCCIP